MCDWSLFQSKLDSKIIVEFLGEETLCLTRWEWDYQACLEVQKMAVDFIRQNPLKKIYIFCNHPQLFTVGRGNQRDLNHALPEPRPDQLPYPVHKIFRGGGLTFHCPGQWIFYPIVKLNAHHYTLHDHLCFLQTIAKNALKELYQINAVGMRNPLGVWVEQQKIASLGVGLERYVTYHGMALNLNYDRIFETLERANPCGLSGKTYISVEQILGRSVKLADFHQHILRGLNAS